MPRRQRPRVTMAAGADVRRQSTCTAGATISKIPLKKTSNRLRFQSSHVFSSIGREESHTQARHIERHPLPGGTVAPEGQSHTHFEDSITHRRRHKHSRTVSYAPAGVKKRRGTRRSEIQTPLCMNTDRWSHRCPPGGISLPRRCANKKPWWLLGRSWFFVWPCLSGSRVISE